MPWWGWMITGTLLLGAELFGINAQFYLVFIGAAAVAVGLIEALGVGLPAWGQWLAFAVLCVIFMMAFRRRLYLRVHGQAVDDRLTLGDYITVPMRVDPGETCRVEYRGSSWNARNIDDQPIESGSSAELCRIDGLTLHVRNPRITQ